MEISREHGERVGGLGSRKMKHIKFDSMGALVVIHDKTFRGEPVRYLASYMYLRQWIDSHLFKDAQEALLWIDFSKLPECVLFDYSAFRQIIKRLIEPHNKIAKKKGLPQIEKISHHIFSGTMHRPGMKRKVCQGLLCAS